MAAFGLHLAEFFDEFGNAVFENGDVNEFELADPHFVTGHVEVLKVTHDEIACGDALHGGLRGKEFHAERGDVVDAGDGGEFRGGLLIGFRAGRGLEDHRVGKNGAEHGARDFLRRRRAEVVVHALQDGVRAAHGHDHGFHGGRRGHVAQLVVIDDALQVAVGEIIRGLSEVGIVDDVHVAARDGRHDFGGLETETFKDERGFGSGVALGGGNDVKTALRVEVGAGDGRNDAVGVGVLVTDDDG